MLALNPWLFVIYQVWYDHKEYWLLGNGMVLAFGNGIKNWHKELQVGMEDDSLLFSFSFFHYSESSKVWIYPVLDSGLE